MTGYTQQPELAGVVAEESVRHVLGRFVRSSMQWGMCEWNDDGTPLAPPAGDCFLDRAFVAGFNVVYDAPNFQVGFRTVLDSEAEHLWHFRPSV